jgi:DNA-binding MarR family transcriptional regulator
MQAITKAGDILLDAWLKLTSTLWNTRLVTSLTYNEAHVMGLLLRYSTDDSPMTATDLISQTRLLKSQMNKLLTSLEHRGLIVRSRALADKRQIHIRLTPEGETAYREEHKGVEAILNKVIERLGTTRALDIARELTDVTAIVDDILSTN